MKNAKAKQALWDAQSRALRHPAEVLCQPYAASGLAPEALRSRVSGNFAALLRKLNVTLLLTREYEHLVLALAPGKKGVEQSFLHLPHPSGLAVDRKRSSVYVAATRNPNQIWKLKPATGAMDRHDSPKPSLVGRPLMSVRTKFLSGATYLHDLAIIGGELYGNSVGQNAVVHIDLSADDPDKTVWWPKSIHPKGSKPALQRNYLQLNSIAAGPSLAGSFFSASGEAPSARRPGQKNYPVDKRGVIFEGKTGKVCARGLTRPHSARLHRGRLWVDNSGYGEFGYVKNGAFQPIVKLPGWTRGLCLIDSVAFVGVSRVLPKFKSYAPGLSAADQICGIYAVDIDSGKVLGSVVWPFGNQIFAIDWMPADMSRGFPFRRMQTDAKTANALFYSYLC